MTVISNGTISIRLYAFIPLIIGIIAALISIIVPSGGRPYSISIAVLGISFAIYLFKTLEDTFTLMSDEIKEEIILQNANNTIKVPYDNIYCFQKESDFHDQHPDRGFNSTTYNVTFKSTDRVETKSFVIWDNQSELHDNYDRLRMIIYTRRKEKFVH